MKSKLSLIFLPFYYYSPSVFFPFLWTLETWKFQSTTMTEHFFFFHSFITWIWPFNVQFFLDMCMCFRISAIESIFIFLRLISVALTILIYFFIFLSIGNWYPSKKNLWNVWIERCWVNQLNMNPILKFLNWRIPTPADEIVKWIQ